MTVHERDERIMTEAGRRSSGAVQRDEPPARGATATGNTDFFVESEARQAVFSAAVADLEPGTRAVLIEGDNGSGKSVFLSRLAAGASCSCVLEPRHPLGEADLCARLAQAFGATADGIVAAIARRCGDEVLIAVDDAHHLSPFALRKLFGLQDAVAEAGGRLQLLLSAPPGELQRRIGLLPSFAPFRADRLAIHALPALTDAEAEEYLRTLLDKAGHPPLEAQQARTLARLAHGNPGHLNRVAADLLRGVQPRPWRRTQGAARRRRLMQPELWVPAALGAAAVAAIFLGYRVLFMPSNDQPRVPLAEIEPATAGMIGALTPSDPARVEDAATQPLEVSPAEPEPEPAVSPPSAVTAPAAAESRPGPEPRPAEPSAPPRAVAAPLDDRSWLLAQDPQRYTIQLASAPDEEKARQLMTRHSLPGRTVAVETVRGSFIVLHGSFASSAEAQRAIAGLPPALRRNEPFARRFESVRNLMSDS